MGLQEQRLHWEERAFTLQTQTDESLSIADEEPFDLTGGAEDRLALCKPPKVRHSACRSAMQRSWQRKGWRLANPPSDACAA